ncbi:pigment biosynthesis protein-like protein yellowish-green 1 [Westerdykella ornata]|uniref:Pigment biosynthesis protein-like protein yellowish-green 1 n=1 Tax=Westerdykella ornata TaxID=318751 RepID=A0A6A6J709_WESOR|nr:pigment biosynthesis protein-like protein yellowish-green 1 [Westerdykella ornata]KAF2272202.1 pigment biosynthesis protein-like protein yellowish-green 1 [Westerdykella ornata]
MTFAGRYWIQKRIEEENHQPHARLGVLWETRWRALVCISRFTLCVVSHRDIVGNQSMQAQKRIYPFMFGRVEDFEPIFEKIKDMERPHDWGEYASAFLDTAARLTSTAQEEENNGNLQRASEYYLRASAVYRIARFPIPRHPTQSQAWELGKAVCIKGLSLRPNPVAEVRIPFVHAMAGEGSDIPAYHLVPIPAHQGASVPLVIIFSGLDGLRTELAVWMEGWREIGVATLVVEIPGTGDCPVNAKDPKAPDRLYSSLFEWIGTQHTIDQNRIAVWGFSTGAYYAIRVAHTHHGKLAGVVALGGGCHHMFDETWLRRCDWMEYPFDCAHALAWKWGYGHNLEEFIQEGQDRFSLLKDGTLDSSSCAKLLLVNGMEDEIFPIDDYFLALQHGPPKEVRLVPGRLHMGEPESFGICLKWLHQVLGIADADVKRQLQALTETPVFYN